MFRSDFETAPGDEADPPDTHFPFNLFCPEDQKAYWKREAHRELIALLHQHGDQLHNLLISKCIVSESACAMALQHARDAASLTEMLVSLLEEQLEELSRETVDNVPIGSK